MCAVSTIATSVTLVASQPETILLLLILCKGSYEQTNHTVRMRFA